MIIGKIITQRALITPHREALIYGDRVFTFEQMNLRVNRLANSLLALGVKKGDRVGLLMNNSNYFLESYFAVSKIGAVLVPLNTRLSVPELEFILQDCGVTCFLFGSTFAGEVSQMAFCREGRPMICDGATDLNGVSDYEAFIAKARPDEPIADIKEEDLNVIMYTSGTTGYPKGAMLSHRGMYGAGVEMLIGLHYQYPERCMILGPFFHSGSITPFLGHVVRGVCTVVMAKFDAYEALSLIERYRIKMMIGVTTIMKRMLQVPELPKFNLSAWQYAILPGSPLPFEVVEEAHSRLGVLCQNLWGMTELCGPGTFVNIEEILNRPESAGTPYFNVDLRIVDYKGRQVPSGEVGELIVMAPHMMMGYWNRPEATAETIRDGWLHTGDLARMDGDGFLYVIDRKKDMLVSGGENVYPAEIERVIREIPQVLEVSVIGVADEEWGEVPRAFIQKVEGSPLSAESVISYCREKLAGYKIPKNIVFLDELPKTPSGKVLKRLLREWDKAAAESHPRSD